MQCSSRSALPFLAALGSLGPASAFISRISKAAFLNSPVSQGRCRASSLLRTSHLCPSVLLSVELRDAILGSHDIPCKESIMRVGWVVVPTSDGTFCPMRGTEDTEEHLYPGTT